MANYFPPVQPPNSINLAQPAIQNMQQADQNALQRQQLQQGNALQMSRQKMEERSFKARTMAAAIGTGNKDQAAAIWKSAFPEEETPDFKFNGQSFETTLNINGQNMYISGPTESVQLLTDDMAKRPEWYADPKNQQLIQRGLAMEQISIKPSTGSDYTLKETEGGFTYFGNRPGIEPVPTGISGKPPEILDPRVIQAKKDIAAAGKTDVTVKTGAEGMTELAKDMAKALVAQRGDAEGAVKGLESLIEAKKLLNAGMITGTGAEFLTNFGNFLSTRMGMNFAEDPVANTQAYAATMGNQVGQIIKQFGSGTGLSDADREYAEKIVGGKITLTEKALKRLLDINEKAYRNVIKNYNKLADQAMKRPGAEQLPYDLRVEMPGEGERKNPPQAAIDHLKAHPELAEEFKKKYGYLPNSHELSGQKREAPKNAAPQNIQFLGFE